jgi:voltage-gated potassium channel
MKEERMPDRKPTEPMNGREVDDRDVQAERWELLGHVQRLLDPLMIALGLAFLVLLVIDFSGIILSPQQRAWLDRALMTIWAAFVVEFLLRLVIAPAKIAFLRANWLSAASLVLPFLRPFRALQAVRAARSLSLVRLLGGANRGMRVLQRITAGRTLAYVGALTILVALLGAVGVLFFDRGAEDATIRTLGDALWWSAAMVTTINNEKFAVTPEGRVIAILLRVFAVSVFGFITASIASYLIGRQAEERPAGDGSGSALEQQLATLREEQAVVRQEMAALRAAIERSGVLGTPTRTGALPSPPHDLLSQVAAPDRQSPCAK